MILGVYGIVVVALITSIIVNFYGEMKKTGNEEAEPLPEEGQATEGADTEPGDTKEAAPLK